MGMSRCGYAARTCKIKRETKRQEGGGGREAARSAFRAPGTLRRATHLRTQPHEVRKAANDGILERIQALHGLGQLRRGEKKRGGEVERPLRTRLTKAQEGGRRETHLRRNLVRHKGAKALALLLRVRYRDGHQRRLHRSETADARPACARQKYFGFFFFFFFFSFLFSFFFFSFLSFFLSFFFFLFAFCFLLFAFCFLLFALRKTPRALCRRSAATAWEAGSSAAWR